jgi:hypothetical protein
VSAEVGGGASAEVGGGASAQVRAGVIAEVGAGASGTGRWVPMERDNVLAIASALPVVLLHRGRFYVSEPVPSSGDGLWWVRIQEGGA